LEFLTLKSFFDLFAFKRKGGQSAPPIGKRVKWIGSWRTRVNRPRESKAGKGQAYENIKGRHTGK
jgi:hypothetical protein